MQKIVGFLAGILLFSNPASAEEAVLVAYDDNAVVIVDLGSIRKLGTTKIWQIARYVNSPMEWKGKEVFTMKTQFSVDCNRNELKRIYISLQDQENRYIDSFPKLDEFGPVIPGSHLEDVYRVACDGPSPDDFRAKNIDEAFDFFLSLLADKEM